MRILLIGLGALLVLIVAAILIGPSLIPASVYRDQIAQAVEKATGRTFKIDGDVRLSVFPSVKAKVQKASLGNMAGGQAQNMAEIGELDVGLALFPLLAHHAEIKSFVLKDAVIHLEVGKDGKANWDFETQSATEPTPSAPQGGASPLSELSFGDVRLVNGLVTYADLKTGQTKEIKDINTKIELPSLDKPLKIDGNAVYNEKKLDITAELDKPRAMLDHSRSAVSFKLSGEPLTTNLTGDVTFGDKMAFAGDAKLDVPSVRALSAWLGTAMSGKKGFGPLSISGHMAYAGDTFSFDNADLKFDAIHATGHVKADMSAKVPAIDASLNTDNLDLRPYIEESKKAEGSAAASPAPAAASWSTEPIDTAGLKAVNATLAFSADKILVRDLTIDKSVLAIAIKSGVLTANLKELALYNGKGNGKVTLDASGAAPQLATNLSLSGLDLQRFMKDAAKTQRFKGTGAFKINVHGAGISQKAIVSSLAGTASINFKDGAIKGVDLAKIANVTNALIAKKQIGAIAQAAIAVDPAQGADNETKFVSMGGDFALAHGVATTDNFKMINDLVSLSGKGSIDLVQQRIDFRVDPGKSQSDGGLKVGLLIKGPLAKPKITPDAGSLVQNELGKVLGKFVGGKKDETGASGETGTTQESSPTQQILQGILGGN